MQCSDHESTPVDTEELSAEHKIDAARSMKESVNTCLKEEYGDKNPYRCVLCSKRFSCNGHLIKHSRVHSGEKPFECTMCGKMFTQGGHLKTHMTIHTGEKPFRCDLCGKTFSTHTGRKRHSRIHTGERPYECHICLRAFIDKCHLKEHSLKHEEEGQQFDCHRCLKSFMKKSAFNSHMREHKEELSWMCGICKNTYYLKGSLNRHFHRFHKGMDSKLYKISLKMQSGGKNKHFEIKTETDEKIIGLPNHVEEGKLGKTKQLEENDSLAESEEILPNI